MKASSRKVGKSEEHFLISMVIGFARKIAALVVTDKASSKKALDFVDGCYEFEKRVHSFMDGDVKKAHELHSSLSGKRRKLLDASKAARKTVGDRVVAYEQEEQRKARITTTLSRLSDDQREVYEALGLQRYRST